MSSLEDKDTIQQTDLLGRTAQGLQRREFMKGAGLLAGFGHLFGCAKKPAELIPYVSEVEKTTQFQSQYYATALEIAGHSHPVIVKSLQGRPIKIEGHPLFASSSGATSLYAQAELYNLYNPKRIQSPRKKGKKIEMAKLQEELLLQVKKWKKTQGEGYALTLAPSSSDGTRKRVEKLKQAYPKLDIVTLDPSASGDFHVRYDLKKTKLLIALDDNLLSGRADAHYYARQFMQRRKKALKKHDSLEMNRLLCFEPQLSQTGVKADERVALCPFEIKQIILKLGEWAGLNNNKTTINKKNLKHAQKIFKELSQSRPNALLTLGQHYPLEWKKRVWEINQKLGFKGHTFWPEKTQAYQGQLAPEDFSEALSSGKYKGLIDLGANPAYLLPNAQLKNLDELLCFSIFPQETTKASHVTCPLKHDLETWKLGKDSLNQLTCTQPLTQPFFPSLSHDEVLAILLFEKKTSDRKIFQEDLSSLYKINDVKKALQSGKINTKETKTSSFPIKASWENSAAGPALELISYPDPSILYGEYSHNPWAQEIPKPVSKITWMNAFYLSPKLAEKYELKTGDYIKAQTSYGESEGPVSILKGVADKTVITTWGYGRDIEDSEIGGKGVNAKKALGSSSIREVEITPLKKAPYQFATTQKEFNLENETVLERLSFKELKKREPLPKKSAAYSSEEFKSSPQWGMTIDLTTCIGCNACTLSCQQENNIPFVGEDEVSKGREMHWIRLDTYRVPKFDDETLHFQPVTCVHCEEAPCETVCPVNATTHSEEGTNQMVYNRCIGTRYCSNNCPYKVRSFNFYNYTKHFNKNLKFALNPDVTVRPKGVMEKCTYCVQRINAHQRNEADASRDSQLQTACQSVCPTQAIQFGDLTDSTHPVQVERQSERYFDLLAELGTKPRTGYLADVKEERE